MKLSDAGGIVKKSMMAMTLFLTLSGFHWWDPFAKWIGIGNKALESGDFSAAENAYSEAEKRNPEDERASFNKGVAAYSREKYEDAAKLFDQAAQSSNPDMRADAYFNRGCAQIRMGDAAGASDSFIEALKNNPDDEDAKVNLEAVRQVLDQLPTPTPPPQENGDQSGENQDSDAPTPTPDPEQTANTNGEPEMQDQNEWTTPTVTVTPESGDSQETGVTPTPSVTPAMEQAPETVPTPEPVKDGVMSQSEAERLLDAQEEEEMEVRKRFHQLPPVRDRQIEKDW